MMITQETDYAIRIVHCMAVSSHRLGAGAIAQKTGVSKGFALKILRKLVAAGLAVSARGAAGGYELARPAGEITLGQVIESISGPAQFSHCQGGAVCTNPTGPCYFKEVFEDVAAYTRNRFHSVTFDSLENEK